MTQMLEDLLNLQKTGFVVPPHEEVDLSGVIAQALDVLSEQIKERNVVVTTRPGLPVVVGDRAGLLTVMQNLLGNAVKFAGHLGAEEYSSDDHRSYRKLVRIRFLSSPGGSHRAR